MTDNDPLLSSVQSQPNTVTITSLTDNDPLLSSVQSQPNTVTITSLTDNDPLPSSVQSQPTVSKSVKWDKYKTTINERRQKYKKYVCKTTC